MNPIQAGGVLSGVLCALSSSGVGQELERFVPPGGDMPFDFARGTVSAFGDALATSSRRGVEVRRRAAPRGWSDPVLIPPPSDSSATFGEWLELGHDILFVGDVRNESFAIRGGAVYVFERTLAGWVLVAKLGEGVTEAEGYFGTSIVLDGDRLAVGVPYRDNFQSAPPGFVQIYERVGSDWIPSARIDGFGPRAGFGWDLDLEDSTLMVGEPGDGMAHFFELDPVAGWVHVAGMHGANFARNGIGVDLDGDQAMSAQDWGMSDTVCPPSEVYFYERVAGSWSEVANLYEPGVAVDQWFQQVRISGSHAFVSARDDYWNGLDGRVVAFEKVAGVWQFAYRVDASGSVNGDSFGASIDLSAEGLFVSAPDAYWTPPPNPAVYEFPWRVSDLANGTCDCSAGPCGNPGASGAGCANSTGQGARLVAYGTTSVAQDDFQLAVEGLPAHRTTAFYMGGAPRATPYGDGLRCVGAGTSGIFRFPLSPARAALPTRLGPGLAEFSSAFPSAGQIGPGQTWYFQAVYRDGGGPCGSGFNSTNAIAADFVP